MRVRTIENPMHYRPEVRLTLNIAPLVTFPRPRIVSIHSGVAPYTGQSIPVRGFIRWLGSILSCIPTRSPNHLFSFLPPPTGVTQSPIIIDPFWFVGFLLCPRPLLYVPADRSDDNPLGLSSFSCVHIKMTKHSI